MTIKQKQCLLAYLGYYTGAIDGIWGRGSCAATKMFQREYGLNDDGVAGPATEKALCDAVGGTMKKVEKVKPDQSGTFWDDIKYFTREEFRCQCGGKYCNGFPVEPQEKLVRTLDKIREVLGVPITIVESGGSGVRCPKHNADVGGVSNSQHLYGKAADLHSTATPSQMKAVAEKVMGHTGGIGLYRWGIHVDVRDNYSRWNG